MTFIGVVADDGSRGAVALSHDTATLTGSIAAEFELLPNEVAGFRRDGNALYPVSRVAGAGPEFIDSTREKPLEVVVAGFENKEDVVASFYLGGATERAVIRRSSFEKLNRLRVGADALGAMLSSPAQRSIVDFGELLECVLTVYDNDPEWTWCVCDALSWFSSNLDGARNLDDSRVLDRAELISSLDAVAARPARLLAAFKNVDRNGDGLVEPAELLVLMQRLLTWVVAFGQDDVFGTLPRTYVRHLMEVSSEMAVQQVFREVGKTRSGGRFVGWTDFFSWYKRGGHIVVPWIAVATSRSPLLMSPTAQVLLLEQQERPLLQNNNNNNDDERRAVYEFTLAPGCGTLDVSATDVANLERLLRATRLYEHSVEEVATVFCSAVDPQTDLLTKRSFDECLRTIVPHHVLPADKKEQAHVSFVLSNIFYAFDRAGTKEVRVDEFCTGFSLLCAGSKSHKLQTCFGLFGEGGSTTPLDFARFIRSVLTMLFALNESAAKRPATAVYRAIDQTTALATRALMASKSSSADTAESSSLAQATSSSRLISFEDFALFYNSRNGHRLVPFVELLDLSKFPLRAIVPLDPAKSTTINNKTNRTTTSGKDGKQQLQAGHIAFAFPMSRGNVLRITMGDAESLRDILEVSKTYEIPPSQIYSALAQGSDRGGVSRNLYDRVVKSFCATWTPSLARFFEDLFVAYDRELVGSVRLKEICSGLSILCAGKKSEKLMLAFGIFDDDRDDRLAREDFARFFRSFLTALFCFAEEGRKLLPSHLWQIIDGASLDLADAVCSHYGVQTVTFDELALWYGVGGYNSASFVELLDITGRKWPFVLGSSDENEEDSSDDDDSNDNEEDEEDENALSRREKNSKEKDDLVAGGGTVFQFELTKTHRLRVSREDIAYVALIVARSGLGDLPAEKVYGALEFVADSSSRKVSRQDYCRALTGLITKERAEASVRDGFDVVHALCSLYDTCDRDPGMGVYIVDLLGITIFSRGTKSVKLAHAWGVLDVDEDGRLSRRELYYLLRSLLVALHAYNYAAHTDPMSHLFHAVDSSANQLAAHVFLSARRKKRNSCSFEEFAQFYSEAGGYELAPWLELLNLEKFVGPAFSSSSRSGVRSSAMVSENDVVVDDDDADNDSETSDVDNNKRPVFLFHLTSAGDTLEVTGDDVDAVSFATRHSKIGDIEPHEMVRLLAAELEPASEENVVSEAAFGRFVGAYVLLGQNPDIDDAIARFAYRLFTAFDRRGAGVVEFVSFAAGLSLIASGSKSNKLSLAWALFVGASSSPGGAVAAALDVDNEDEQDNEAKGRLPALSRRAFSDFLGGVLTAIASFTDFFAVHEDPWGVIDRAADETSTRVFAECESPELSFDEFAAFYTSAGFEHMSWIELLSLSKWKQGVTTPTAAASASDIANARL